jgi:uncharacterized protein YqhQ
MNEERTGLWLLWQAENTRSHLWHKYSIMVNQVMVKWLRVFSACHSNHNPVLSSFMIYNRIFKKSNTTGANDRAGMFRTPEFTLDYSGVHSFIYSCILLTIVCLFVLSLFLVIVLSNYGFWVSLLVSSYFFLYFIWLRVLKKLFYFNIP